MALPDTILAEPGLPGHNPVHKSSGGNYYAVIFDATNTHIEVWKSTNPGTAAWSEQDSANHINRDCETITSITDGNIIHIVTVNSTDWLIKYHRFNMGTDAWDTTNSDNTVADVSGMSAPTSRNMASVSVALTTVSSQELVIAGPGLKDTDMGSSYDRADYWYGPKTGTPSWTGPTSIDASVAARQELRPVITTGTNNKVHVLWQTATTENTANGTALRGRTITLPTTLSTVQTASVNGSRIPKLVTYDDSGTQRLVLIDYNSSGGFTPVSNTVEDGSDNLGSITVDSSGPWADVTDQPTTGTYSLRGSLIADGADVYLVYGSAGSGGAGDLYYLKSTDDGATWTDRTEEVDAVTVEHVSADILDASTIAVLFDDGGTTKYTEISIGGGHTLLADDVQSTSEVTSPSVGQTHALTSTSVESASQVSTPAVGQEHGLTATSVESASEVSQPTAAESHALTATSVDSASELTSPAIGQAHALTNPGVDSASELTAPVVTQEHALAAAIVESASELTAPAVGQEHALTATSVESASELTTPAVSEAHALLANDVESVSELTVPAVGQVHALTNNGAESASETSSPAVGQEHALLSTGTDSASEVTNPAVTQEHALTSVSVESASQVSNPAVAEAGHALLADDVESTSEVSSPAVGQAHALTVVSTESASELTVPAVGQAHSLTATSVESASELTAPVLAEGTHDLLADDVESASEVTTPALGQEHALTVVSAESASEVSAPVLQSGVVSQPVTGGGWALPHHEKKKPAPKVVETVAEQGQPVEEKERARKTITLKKPANFEAEKTKALGIEADIIARRIDEEEARLLAAEIEALEAAIEQDRIDAEIIEFEKAAAALKARQEEEEMMVMLLVASL